jgi:hypothetical protein
MTTIIIIVIALLSAIIPSVTVLSSITLTLAMLIVIMPSVILLTVMALITTPH